MNTNEPVLETSQGPTLLVCAAAAPAAIPGTELPIDADAALKAVMALTEQAQMGLANTIDEWSEKWTKRVESLEKSAAGLS
jgi:hypothetical protein